MTQDPAGRRFRVAFAISAVLIVLVGGVVSNVTAQRACVERSLQQNGTVQCPPMVEQGLFLAAALFLVAVAFAAGWGLGYLVDRDLAERRRGRQDRGT